MYKKLATVFLLKSWIVISIICPVLADTSKQGDRRNNVDLIIGIIGISLTGAGLGWKLKKTQDKNQKLAEDLANNNRQITKLQETSEQKSDRVKELEQSLEKQQIKIAQQMKLEQQINQIQLRIKQLEDSQKQSQELLNSKNIEISKLQEQLKQQKSQLSQNKAALEQQLVDKDSQITLQTENLNNLQQLIGQTQLQLEQLEDSESTSQKALENKQLEITKLQEQLKQQESEFIQNRTELEEQLAEKNSHIITQNKNLENCQQQIYQIQSKIDRFEKVKASSKFTIQSVQLENEKQQQYEKLILFLSTGKWQKANRETANIFLRTMNQEKSLRLDLGAINNFPEAKFQEIDRLWRNYSQERFSFSIQLKIWEELGGISGVFENNLYQEWAKKVGWLNNGSWKVYSGLNTTDATVGQFPAISLFWSDWGSAWCAQETIALFSKIKPTESQENQSKAVDRETININNNIFENGKQDIQKGIQDIGKGLKKFGDSLRDF